MEVPGSLLVGRDPKKGHDLERTGNRWYQPVGLLVGRDPKRVTTLSELGTAGTSPYISRRRPTR